MRVEFEETFQKLDFPLDIIHLDRRIISINKIKMLVEGRTEVRPIQASNIVSHYSPHDMPLIVIAQYITPKAKKILRNNSINYIDNYGNAYIVSGGTKIYVEKNNATPPQKEYSDIFTVSGGRVVYQLLIEPDRIKATYRELSELSQVSLGTVSKVLNSLRDEGFVKNNYEGDPELINREKLLEKWIILFNEKMLPSLKIGNYSFMGPAFDKIDEEEETRWGGESGAAGLTDYLNPEKFTVFTNRNPRNFPKELKLYPDENGIVSVFKVFWKKGSNPQNYPHNNLYTHPLLIYAELIYSDSERNKETAQLIYNEHIKPKL